MTRNFFILIFVVMQTFVYGQFEKQLFFTFDTEEVNQININVVDDFEVQTWEGDHVLVQENIQLFDATLNIFRYFVGEGRYNIEGKVNAGQLELTSKDPKAYAIRTKKGECYEVVKLIILIPENFEGNNQQFTLKSDETN